MVNAAAVTDNRCGVLIVRLALHKYSHRIPLQWSFIFVLMTGRLALTTADKRSTGGHGANAWLPAASVPPFTGWEQCRGDVLRWRWACSGKCPCPERQIDIAFTLRLRVID
ncbi:hypothetical protein EB241_19275 [Erwinia psidii]|uniref:Uncharacterized protein n=1 Tax=Erwinia psidii TaxID=69224 RepID=A0A3N6RUR4_9GAMM|nr:hypothetical protein EB241_19275 [Erwinia psidii]